jgi:hypothetical protein
MRTSILFATVMAAVVAAAAPAAAATAPAGYQYVFKAYSAPQSTFTTMGQVACPAGTVTWGGGVGFSAWSPPVTIASSYWNGATPGAWVGAVGEAQPFTASFYVAAACANKPSGYKLVSKLIDDPAHALAAGKVRCPIGTVLLSGGLASDGDTTNVYQVSAAPVSNRAYVGYQENGSSIDEPFHLYALCAAKPAGYARVSTSTTVNAGDQGGGSPSCPTSTVAIGGGLLVSTATAGVIPEESRPGTQIWQTLVDNTTTSPTTVTSTVVCAA